VRAPNGLLPYRLSARPPARAARRTAWAFVDLGVLVLMLWGTWRTLPWQPCAASLPTTVEPLPAPHARLTGIAWGDEGWAMAVGQRGAVYVRDGELFHPQGTWRALPSVTTADLASVAIGAVTTKVHQFVGWYSSPSGLEEERSVRAVAVGDRGTALDCYPSGCIPIETRTSANLRAATADPHPVTVGDGGTVLALRSNFCDFRTHPYPHPPCEPTLHAQALQPPTTRRLNAVAAHCAEGACLLIAVGEQGTIVELAGPATAWDAAVPEPEPEAYGTWTARPSPTCEDLVAVWLIDGVWHARAPSGKCLLRDGESWRSAAGACEREQRGPVHVTESKLWARRDGGTEPAFLSLVPGARVWVHGQTVPLDSGRTFVRAAESPHLGGEALLLLDERGDVFLAGEGDH